MDQEPDNFAVRGGVQNPARGAQNPDTSAGVSPEHAVQDRIIGLLVESRVFLLENVRDSLGILSTGFLWGASVGFLTGLLLGYFKGVGYWLNPVTKIIGPIPTTAWIPLALSTFPTTHGANVFLIAFAVWFPVTLMTSSGIQTINNVNFEISCRNVCLKNRI